MVGLVLETRTLKNVKLRFLCKLRIKIENSNFHSILKVYLQHFQFIIFLYFSIIFSRSVWNDVGGVVLESDEPTPSGRSPANVAGSDRKRIQSRIVVGVATVRPDRRRSVRNDQGLDPLGLDSLLPAVPGMRSSGQALGRICSQDFVEQELGQCGRFSTEVPNYDFCLNNLTKQLFTWFKKTCVYYRMA